MENPDLLRSRAERKDPNHSAFSASCRAPCSKFPMCSHQEKQSQYHSCLLAVLSSLCTQDASPRSLSLLPAVSWECSSDLGRRTLCSPSDCKVFSLTHLGGSLNSSSLGGKYRQKKGNWSIKSSHVDTQPGLGKFKTRPSITVEPNAKFYCLLSLPRHPLLPNLESRKALLAVQLDRV